MRRVAVLLVIIGGVAGLAVTAGHRTPPETVDTLPVFIPVKGPLGVSQAEFVWGVDAIGRGPVAGTLAVFRSSPRPSDMIPASELRPPTPRFTPRRDLSRLLVDRAQLRLYAYPTRQGEVCYLVVPGGEGSCLQSLLDGAWPQVRSRRDVWGLVDDAAIGVDVQIRNRVFQAALGRNAFYLPLPTGVVAPTQIVVRDRDGARHRYVIRRCRLDRITPLTGINPVGPGFCE